MLLKILGFVHNKLIGKLSPEARTRASELFKEYIEIVAPDTININVEGK